MRITYQIQIMHHARKAANHNFRKLQASLDVIYKELEIINDKGSLKKIEVYNVKTEVINSNISVGDFVLVRRIENWNTNLHFGGAGCAE